MQEIFPQHEILIPKDEGLSFNPVENGNTFYENSLIKARALWEVVHCPVIADDSGICVDALNGAPGIYSARYGGPSHMKGLPDGEKIPQDKQNLFLIQQTSDALKSGIDIDEGKKHGLFKNGPRSAHYVCAMVLYQGPDRLYVAQETMEGCIIEDIKDSRGQNGFGYDPIFYLPEFGKTTAEISPEEKNLISHRGKAARILQKIFEIL